MINNRREDFIGVPEEEVTVSKNYLYNGVWRTNGVFILQEQPLIDYYPDKKSKSGKQACFIQFRVYLKRQTFEEEIEGLQRELELITCYTKNAYFATYLTKSFLVGDQVYIEGDIIKRTIRGEKNWCIRFDKILLLGRPTTRINPITKEKQSTYNQPMEIQKKIKRIKDEELKEILEEI